ncbi:unnamed protein product, partial [Staurois parvus]
MSCKSAPGLGLHLWASCRFGNHTSSCTRNHPQLKHTALARHTGLPF